jgi:competence protein ComEC
MALCLFSAQYFIRPYMIGRALLVALVIMVWVSPYSILFDLSLQLSFLATLGIVYLFPILKNKYEKLSENFLGEIVLQTIAVNILVLPLILYQIGSVSPVFLPLNVLVLGFVPFLTIGGFIVTAIGFVSSSIAIIGAYPIQFMTDSIIRLAQWTSQHDPFYIILEPFSLKILIGVYGCVLIYLIIKNSRQNVSNTIM